MEIDCGVCKVRSWRLEDAEAIVRHANNRKIWLNLRDRFPHPYSDRDAQTYLKHVVSTRPEVNFAIEFEGHAMGGIGVELHSGVLAKTGSIGYWVGEPYWRKGIATAVVRAFAHAVMETHGLARLEARVFSWNDASMRVLEKCGFHREALLEKRIVKDGMILDEIVYARTSR